MLRNYLKIAYRNLTRNKGYSFINIGGLAVGMAVAMLIGLWMHDELDYDKSFENHDRIAQVMQHITQNGTKVTQSANPYLLAQEIRSNYGDDFKYVLQSTQTRPLLAYKDKKFSKEGRYFEPEVTEMLSLKMVRGTRSGLVEPYSILLAKSVADSYFGEEDPLDKTLKMDDRTNLKVTGVYEDFTTNSSFSDLGFIVPWDLYLIENTWIKELEEPWRPNFTQTYAQLAEQADLEKVSAKIKDVKLRKVSESRKKLKPEVFLHPMSKWHLYSEFKNGVNIGGRIENVWLFGIIGAFVLLLACINFMNLSTARSEKRAKEVGIRKSVGSIRSQLVSQFLSESFLVVGLAFLVAMLLVLLSIPAFNALADKQIAFPWGNLYFWGASLLFIVFTAMLSGSYPALYLSSFQPVKVLKGTFRVGRYAALPRKVLVVLQFTVSVALIIGTVTVFRQIQFTKNRPIGYDRANLVQIPLTEGAFEGKYAFIRNELLNSGAVTEMSATSNPTTDIYYGRGGYYWEGMAADFQASFAWIGVSPDYVKSLDMKVVAGRDFSPDFPSDSNAVLLNKAAVEYMGLKEPVGTLLRNYGADDPSYSLKVIGVVENMVMDSPYDDARPSLYEINKDPARFYHLRLDPDQSTSKSLATVEGVFKKNFPDLPFQYKFVDDEYAAKFSSEERIGKLAGVFTALAILISCLGLFGLASYVAEQRTKEIGVRKVLGASVASLWRLLSKDFVLLVVIALFIAAPLAWYFMDGWLQKYTYRTELSWWIFAAAGAGALVITLLTVSFQAVKAALMNPVKSLRSE